jgi:excisionase family DNA binding protein
MEVRMDQKIAEQPTNQLFSVEQAGEYLGMKRTYVFGLVRSGELPSFKLGRMRKIRRVDLDEFIERKLAEAEQKQ